MEVVNMVKSGVGNPIKYASKGTARVNWKREALLIVKRNQVEPNNPWYVVAMEGHE